MRKSLGGFTLVLMMLSFLVFIITTARTATTQDTITLGQSIRDGETVVSAGEAFELGFFSPGGSKSRYLGIWYKKLSTGTVTWVANRDAALSDQSGVLTLTRQGILVLLNSTNDTVWSSNASATAQNPSAVLLDSGNLVVKDGNDNNPDNFLWQSFDYPSDTLLPGMKLGLNLVSGLNRFLSSWQSIDDPVEGAFKFMIDPHGFPQLVLRRGSEITFRPGPWNGLRWSGAPTLEPNSVYTYEFVSNGDEVFFKFELRNSSIPSRMVLNPSGNVQRFTWIDRTGKWAPYSAAISDQCDNYALCGTYGICDINDSPICACLDGFVPKSPSDWNILDWSDGCVRRTQLACENGDGFLKLSAVKLPDTRYSWDNMNISLFECEKLCSNNCSCTAYANSNVSGEGSGCLLWFDDLIDIRVLPKYGQDIYVRLAASELENIRKRGQSNQKKQVVIIVTSVSLAVGLLLLGCLLYMRKKRMRKQGWIDSTRELNSIHKDGREEEMELPIFDLTTIANATDNFSNSNKLGQGGFGPVYKGILIEGQEIAVKRLCKSSGQGMQEFKNEVIVIAKLQHRNLVKLLGCCIHGDERMLIYEYMPNKSLDIFIFDKTRSKLLDSSKRINIIGGIARGLLYLHQDSRLRIIHRDLKASNILLDNEMNPKISDFGMAKTFWGDQTEANTNKVVGTYGYMSPEYAVDGLFSVKSDVFSFGVLVLEIISGKRNRGFHHACHQHNLLGHAWRLWIEGRPAEVIDESLDNSCNLSELLRCIHVGLLCVQQGPEDRPHMSTVVLMLNGERSLPQPKQPGFFTERILPESESSSSKLISSSTNEITFSSLEPR